ncbi:Fungal Zn2-Cys6 binuclear cluster domain-containing protein [Cladophialophora immunda]|nr:Fungal Zn2-Cys6 binuclear cluster domain-containing protein [Cladophialophora immunda]
MVTPVNEQPSQKRVANACQYCKRRKIKCSGTAPCTNCTRRQISCVFEEVDKKVLVSERYLLELERQHNDSPGQEVSGAARTPSVPSLITPNVQISIPGDMNNEQERAEVRDPELQGSDEQSDYLPSDSITNPLVSHTSTHVRDSVGRYRFLGPSSTWTFSQRVFNLLKDAFPEAQSTPVPLNLDGTAYQLDWTSADRSSPVDTTDLPSMDYTLYLMNAVKFHTCQMFRPFDEEDFTRNLYEFHERGLDKVQSSKLWFIEFLLVIALGKAVVIVVKDPTTAPGSIWFQRAMSIMPDFVGLQREPNLAIQVLCLVALYLISVDWKEAAYGYIGQAVRLCLVEGFHRGTPRQIMGDRVASHHRDIWWTVYILDRRLSSMIGVPSSVQDVDITCPLPGLDDHSQRGTVLNINVKISRLMTQIINSVYSVERLGRPFVKTVQSVLRDMAAIAHEMDVVCSSAAYGSIGAVSTVAGHIQLSYHQCILLATRPLLLHLMIARLEGSNRFALVKYCTNDILDSFLPFDLESAFSAAFIVTMASALVPTMIVDAATYRATSDRIIDYLIRKGNVPAQLRKKELLCLDQMIQPLLDHRDQHLPPPIHASQPPAHAFSPDFGTLGGWRAGPGESGFSPSQMLNIADQLDTHTQGSATINGDWTTTSPWVWWTEQQNDQMNQFI